MVSSMDFFSPQKKNRNRRDNARTQGQQAPKVKPRRTRPKGWLSTSCVPLPSNQPKKNGLRQRTRPRLAGSARPHTAKVKPNAWARSAKCEKGQAPQGKIIKDTKVLTEWASLSDGLRVMCGQPRCAWAAPKSAETPPSFGRARTYTTKPHTPKVNGQGQPSASARAQ